MDETPRCDPFSLPGHCCIILIGFFTNLSFSNYFSRYFNCLCKRCGDPTELGSHLSSLLCPKCDQTLPVKKGILVKDNLANGCVSGDLSTNELRGIMTQVDPLQDDSPWKCPIHNFVYTRSNVDKLVTDLKRHFLEVVGFFFFL